MVKQTLLAIDPYGFAEGLEHLNLEEEMEADLVSFKGSAEHVWIHQALGLPTKWWVLHSSKIPLLLEIRELIKAKKASQGSSSRLPQQQGCLVLLKVRNRILFIQNSTTQMSLALAGSLENKTGTLDWFLKEWEKDIKSPPERRGAW